MKTLRFSGKRLLAAFAVVALTLSSFPLETTLLASARTDALANNLWKVDDTPSGTTVYTSMDYLLCAPDQSAMTASSTALSSFPSTAASTDDDGTYYDFKESDTSFLRWVFTASTSGTACYLQPSADTKRYVGLDGTTCCLTTDVTKALLFAFHQPEDASEGVALYVADEAQYLAWNGKTLTLQETATSFVLNPLTASHNAYFYAVSSGTQATLNSQIAAWSGDSITLPELPERDNATPVQWNQIDPNNNNAVLGSYAAGSVFGPVTAATYFLAEYAMDTASVSVIGNGAAQALSAKVGQTIAINVNTQTGYGYVLYDEVGAKQTIQKTDNGDNTAKLQFAVTSKTMFLTVTTSCSEYTTNSTGFLRICNAEDLRLFASLVNVTTKPRAFDAILVQDIDLSTVCSVTKGTWTPIGAARDGKIGATDIRFAGNGHTISNLYSVKTTDMQGLFGCVTSLAVSNLTVNGQVQGGNTVGGFVASCDTLTATNCGTMIAVSGAEIVGGFCGMLSKTGTFTDCFAARSVRGTAATGLFFGTAGVINVSNGFLYGTAVGVPTTTPLGVANSIIASHLLLLDTLATKDTDSTLHTTLSASAFKDGTALTALRANCGSAIWMQSEEHPVFGNGVHSIFAAATNEGGTVKFDKMSYVTGALVSFTALPKTDYNVIVTGVTVNGKMVLPIEASTDETGAFWFYMPADDVTITIQFVEKATSTKMGDVNCDQNVDIGDVILLSRFIAEDSSISISKTGLKLADCNGDGTITSADATLIMKLIAKLIVVVE